MSAAENVGMDINLDLVPTRQADMKDWEILLSESRKRECWLLLKKEKRL